MSDSKGNALEDVVDDWVACRFMISPIREMVEKKLETQLGKIGVWLGFLKVSRSLCSARFFPPKLVTDSKQPSVHGNYVSAGIYPFSVFFSFCLRTLGSVPPPAARDELHS